VDSLQDLAERVAAVATQFRDVKAETKKVEQNVRLASELGEATSRVSLRSGFLKAAIEDGSIDRGALPLAAVQTALRAVQSAMDSAPDDLVSNASAACRALEALAATLKVAVQRGWSDVTGSLSLAERSVLVEALKHVPAYERQVTTLSSLLRTLQAQVQSDYLSAADYRLFKETLEEFETEFARLQLTDSEGVQRFLRRFIAGLATLEDLTPEIHDWIKQQDIEQSFFLRPGRSA
jgi:hypothetical protein